MIVGSYQSGRGIDDISVTLWYFPATTPTDAPSLAGAVQEDLRQRAAKSGLSGMTHARAAALFGVTRHRVTRWVTDSKTGDTRG